MTSLQSRLNRIANRLPRERCPWCGNHPSRLVYVDGVTEAVLSESMPESGCSACGRVPFRTLVIVGEMGDVPDATMV